MNVFNLSSPRVLTLAFMAALGIAMADDWAAGDALYLVLQLASGLVVVTYLLARFIVRLGLLERQSDTDLLERIGRVLRLPAIAGYLVFLAITIDPHLSAAVSPPRQITFPVERIPCAGSGLRPAVAVKDGRICLRREDGQPAGLAHPASVERVDLALVPSGFAVGARGRLVAEEVSRGVLTRTQFIRPVALTPY